MQYKRKQQCVVPGPPPRALGLQVGSLGLVAFQVEERHQCPELEVFF